MQGLTKRQEQTLDFIRHCIEERGYPPTRQWGMEPWDEMKYLRGET